MSEKKIYCEYLWSLLKHKWYVVKAGMFLGGIPLWRLIVHDWQKFTPLEFKKYARNFFGKKPSDMIEVFEIEKDFSYAWLHHENTAPHHWGYWIPRSGKETGNPLEMPIVFVREMIADWMGASKTYTGSFDIAVWFNKNVPGFTINEKTSDEIADIMYELGYFLTDNCDFSWMAGGKIAEWIDKNV